MRALAVASLVLGACLDAQEGRVRDSDAASALDATGDVDAPGGDDTDAAPPSAEVPTGAWTREHIGDCLHFFETLVIAGESATWTRVDDTFCGDPAPDEVRTGTARRGGDHVLELVLGPSPQAPSELVWTWALGPGAPETLFTTAYRRVGDSDRFRREDRERHDNEYGVSERLLDVEVRLVGYPDVTEMIVDFDVSHTFSDGTPRRGGSGQLRWPARRRVLPSGRVVFVAGDYEVKDYPDTYAFGQELLQDFDGYTVDLVTAAFAPVLWEVEGDPASLVVSTYTPLWRRASR